MTDEGARPLDREGVVNALVEHYAQDHLPMSEFEHRVERAHQSRTREELRALLADLPTLAGGAPGTALQPSEGGGSGVGSARGQIPATAGEAALAGVVRLNLEAVQESQTEVAIFSGRVRKGPWRPARKIRAVGCMGGVELDFREALFPPGEVRVVAVAIMGGVEILVPPGVRVETDGFAFMGGFDEETGGSDLPAPAPDAPVLRVSGVAVMGGVEVHCRLPGESARDAKRRRKEAARRLTEGNR